MGRSAVLQLAVFIGAGLIMVWPSIDYPWYGDDLHLIRVFSPEELRSAWTRSWDVDDIETAGYRPLTVLFNHARASLFGEVRAMHRVFVVVLVAVYLVLVGAIGRRFRLTPAAMTLAGLIMLSAKYSSYHLAWISDGVHAAQGILFALSALAVLRWVDSGATGWITASVTLFLLSVLTREDSLAIGPVLIGAAIFLSRATGRWTMQRNSLLAYAAVLACISLAALLARQAVLPPGTDQQWTLDRSAMLHPVQLVTLAGFAPRALPVLFLCIFVLLLLVVLRSKRDDAGVAWMWLCFAMVSSSPGIVESRVNLLFFPVTFYCVFVAHVLTRYASGDVRLFGKWDRPLAFAVALCCIVLPARESRRQQWSMAPESTELLFASCDIAIHSELAGVTASRRRAEALRGLQVVGLTAADCSSLWDESGALNEHAKLPPGVFVPPSPFLSR